MDFYKTHLSDDWATVRGPGRLLIAPETEPIPDSISDIMNTSTFDAGGNWIDLGATKGGISLGYTKSNENMSLDLDTKQIRRDYISSQLIISTSLAENTYESFKYAWDASDSVSGTETVYYVGTPHRTPIWRVCLGFKNAKTNLIRLFVIYRATIAPQNEMNFGKSGDQVQLGISISALPDLTESDIKKRFMKIIEQPSEPTDDNIILI